MSEAASYADAWADRRRRMVTFRALQFLALPLIIGVAYFFQREGRRGLLVVGLWLFAYFGAGVWLNRFRCPRCGKLYYWSLERKGYAERQKNWSACRHCGLHQDEVPTKT